MNKKEEMVKISVDLPEWLYDLVIEVKKKTGIPMNMQIKKALIKFYSPYRQYIGKGSYKEVEDAIWKE